VQEAATALRCQVADFQFPTATSTALGGRTLQPADANEHRPARAGFGGNPWPATDDWHRL